MTAVTFFVGTYTSDDGRGVYLLDYNAQDDSWALGASDPLIENCSFAAFSPRTGVHYLLDEGGNTVSSCLWRGDDGWQRLQSLPTCGGAPCFVALEDDGSCLAVANYQSGHVAQYRIDLNGRIWDPIQVYAHAGRGPNPDRQEGPHAHCARFRGGRLYSTDLGTDSVLMRRIAAEGDTTVVAFQAPPGEGPRHICFHPRLPVAYLLSELGSKVFVLRMTADGRLEEIQRLSTLPDGYAGESLGGHIAMNAALTRLYVSNRGHDSLAVFAIADDGQITLLQHASTHSQSPRHFHLAEAIGRIIVAHQNGNSVVVLVLEDDGRIGERKAALPVPQAAFIGALDAIRMTSIHK
ncbi:MULTISPECIES: lactonase family protein [Asticcacaulis]|uniref:lactonase family protein n=1 Tax=Asticcacaulis TaxID=76890 RepID=UPI001AE8B6A4|nr:MULTISPECIES: lactonase family protein [Asticcacaulis]MBP2159359.1 6-phosphogluconolactonase [Asticcacaulis solisilvae]MDR6800404.1 6-phosphogluconolactonase [Asticcacaulis sp. BE141]